MPGLDEDFRRLAARGYFEITPSVHGVRLQWAPRGQAGPHRSGSVTWNPFCTRAWSAPTVAEVLTKAVEATRPVEWSLETLVSRMLYERERARKETTGAR